MFWDSVAGVYSLFENVYNHQTNQAVSKAVAKLLCKTDAVLECACGTGLFTQAAAPRCAALTATDFSEKMLLQTRKNCSAFSNIRYEQADISHLPYDTDSFDKVIAGNVIHLLDEPQKAIDELKRVCKSGGTLIIPTYICKNQKAAKPGLFIRIIDKMGVHFKREFSFAEYQRFIQQSGFPDAAFALIAGRIPCAIAVIPNP
ncbi:MAG: methyltransferase domain-containing protein [Oscillospiraceae bacterium]|nr:methyltransferase domain-containing protein [Oscillospiraceae bacterium]